MKITTTDIKIIKEIPEEISSNMTRLRLYINKNIELKTLLENLLEQNKNYLTILKLTKAIITDFRLPLCEKCSKELTYRQYEQKIKFCSSLCAKDIKISKMQATLMEQYGENNPSKIKEFSDKRQNTFDSKFNGNPLKDDTIKNKIKQTNLKKYGFENVMQNEIIKNKAISKLDYDKIKEKQAETNLNKYGTRTPLQNSEIKEKVFNTNLKRYGHKSPLSNKNIQDKIKQTNLKKYGVENPLANEIIKQKRDNTNLERYNNIIPAKSKIIKDKSIKRQKTILWQENYLVKFNKLKEQNIEVLTTFDEYLNNDKFRWFKLKCTKCNNIFDSYLTSYRAVNLPCCPYCNITKSTYENKLLNFIKEYDNTSNILINDRKAIKPFELDLYIENKQLAIEINGLYHHSETCGKDKNYHLNKTNSCIDKNIQLIHIFEDELIESKQIVYSRIKHLLKLDSYKIYARKCIIKELDNKSYNKFVNKYHIQGTVNAKVKLGLFYKKRLVAVMSFSKPRFNKKYDWELLRYCSINNFSIIGGASKLLSYFKKNYIGSIISYADKRWSNGNLYKQLGFLELEDSPPNYFYVKGLKRYSRVMFQKHKLKDMLKDFDESLTESENMINNGYNRIWDCGNKVFVMEKPKLI